LLGVAGESAKAIADHAANLGIPVVRFVADSKSNPHDVPHPLYERPAMLVFANTIDLRAFGDEQMQEAARLILETSRFALLLQPKHACSMLPCGMDC
jgi:hypothetical protein